MTELAIFTHNLALGGAQRVIVNLSNELDARGIDVEIVLKNKQGELIDQVHDGIAVVDLATEAFIQAALDLRDYVQITEPDVLLSTVNTANLMALLAVKTTRTDTKNVVRIASTLSKEAEQYDDRLTDRPIPYLMNWLYPRADRVIAVSEGLARDMIEHFGVARQRIEVIYNPTVTPDLFEKADEPLDHPWFDDAETDVILGVGRLSPQKDFSTLLRAFSRLEQTTPRKLVILGDGSERSNLETLASRLEISDDVSLPGTVSNPYPYMFHADLFVLSSRWEGCPNVLIEAMACGCPVVSTDCPHGPREILEDGKYGPLIPVGDDRSLSKTIADILGSPPNSDLLTGRSMDFHVETIAPEYEELLYSGR